MAGEKRPADVIAFVDEAGPRGYLRNLTPAMDADLSVLCALPLPAECVERAREAIRPSYDAFCAAAPAGAKIHITDAFELGNGNWAEVARQVREELFGFFLKTEMRIIYAARRFRVARATFEMNEAYNKTLQEARSARGPSNIVIPGASRPSGEQVDDRLLKDLTLLMDMFVESEDRSCADFYFDEITDTAADRFQTLISDLRQTGDRVHTVKYRDLSRGESLTKSARLTIKSTSHPDLRLNVAYVNEVRKIGKTDPLVFAVDVVTNSLWRHLSGLAAADDLNDETAVAEWPLGRIVYGVSPPGASQMDRL